MHEPGAIKIKYYLERRICKRYNIKHTLIPDFIVPRYLWSAATIVECLTAAKNDLIDGPDERTISRWRKAIAEGRLVIDFVKKVVISVS